MRLRRSALNSATVVAAALLSVALWLWLYYVAPVGFVLLFPFLAFAVVAALCGAVAGRIAAARYVLLPAVLCALAWVAGAARIVQGVEFSPETFSYRAVRYVSVGGALRILSRTTPPWSTAIDDYIRMKYLPPQPAQRPHWDFAYGAVPPPGDKTSAYALQKSLELNGEGSRWIAWSDANPEQSRLVWHTVTRWALSRRYIEAGGLLEEVRRAHLKSTAEIRAMIDVCDAGRG